MGRDKEVSNAFVRIGAKNTDLKRSFAEAETIANATLGRMGRAMTAFGSAFAGRIGLPLAGAGAAGLGATVAAVGKSADSTAAQLGRLGIALGESGGNFRETLNVADAFSSKLQTMIGFTRTEGREMAILATQFGFGGKKLEELLKAGSGLAIRRGKEPIEGVRALIDTVFKGRTLEEFGVFVKGPTTRAVQQAGIRRGLSSFDALSQRGALPGTTLDRFTSQISRTTTALAEFAGELVGDTLDKLKASRLKETVDRTLDIGEKMGGQLGDIFGGLQTARRTANTLNPFGTFGVFGPLGEAILSGASQRFEEQGQGLREDISGARFNEVGLTDQERFDRGPLTERNQQLGDTGAPDNLVERLDANTEAVKENTREIQRTGPGRPP